LPTYYFVSSIAKQMTSNVGLCPYDIKQMSCIAWS